MPRLDQTSAANGFPRRIAWFLGIDRIRLPAAILVALLQRAPAVRAVADIANHVLESPAGALIRAAAASVAALGAVDSMAGATAYVLSTGSPGHPSPYTVNTGSQIEGVAFALTSTPPTAAPPQSWTIGGSIPPGLEFGTTGHFITAPGTVNASIPTLVGTPTTPGTYTMTLQAWEFTGGTGLFSSVFTYEVIVESGPTPTPSPTPTPTPTPSPTPTPVSGAAPVFTVQPISVAVPGGTVALAAQASNSPSYQWMLNGLTPVPGATGPILEFANAATASGSYTCVATNSAGSATSNAAAISLTGTADLGRLINISCRAQVGTGGNILIAGFVVGGQGTAGSEPLLVRGSGPALASFGVTGTLPDPGLQLFSGSTVLGTNNGWGGSAQIANAAASVGAFAWTNSSSHDSALLEDLQSGPFTAQIQGESGDTGVALVEVYDATPAGTYTPASPRLVNISTRVQVGSGGGILIAGFVIGGSTAKTVLIRASGPALAAFGVSGTLPDPQLGLYSGSAEVDSNSSWGGNAQIAAAAAAVGAFAWTSASSHDSAILVTLPPGAYTAQVSGQSGDTGVALIEIYEVP